MEHEVLIETNGDCESDIKGWEHFVLKKDDQKDKS